MNLENNNSTDSTQSSESAPSSESAKQPEQAKKPARRRVVRSAGTPSAIIASVSPESDRPEQEKVESDQPAAQKAESDQPAAKKPAAKKSPARKTAPKTSDAPAEQEVDTPAQKPAKADRPARAPKGEVPPLDVLSEFGLKAPEAPEVPETAEVAVGQDKTQDKSQTPAAADNAEKTPRSRRSTKTVSVKSDDSSASASKTGKAKRTGKASTAGKPDTNVGSGAATESEDVSESADESTSAGGRLATTALLFQAPDPAARPKRRRASAPAGPPEAVAPSFAGVHGRGEEESERAESDEPESKPAQPAKQSKAGQKQGKTQPKSGVVPTRDAESDQEAGAADASSAGVDEDTDSSHGDESDETGNGSGNARRRRRRGGRGRRNRNGSGSQTSEDSDGSGEESSDDQSDDSATSAQSSGSEGDKPSGAEPKSEKPGRGAKAAADESDSRDGDEHEESDDHDDSNDESEGSSSRRRRRRRRGGRGSDSESGSGSSSSNGSNGSNSSTRDSSTRTKSRGTGMDEVTALKGSTRLEAKRQRRREGRDAGRRRTIVTEAEFLARRESVDRTMVVREKSGRTQIAVLEDGVLVEHYVSQQEQASVAGNVYLGRVQNVLPSMEAAFIDIGKGRNAVLYAGEVNWDAAGLEGQPRRIEQALKSGDSVLVQVTKDPIGHKGARLTSQITLAGRYLVYVPGGGMTGISRKLPDMERARLKKILRELVPDNAGVIVRTAAEGASEEELRADIARLQDQWTKIEKKAKTASAPALLQGEPDLAIRVVRDIFNDDFKSLVISGNGAWDEISGYVGELAPDLAERVTRWTDSSDVFAAHRVDEQLAKGMDRKVWLPSGGSLVIDRTEAMTVVDVNTGKFTGSGGTLEETVTRNNLEAAEEIVRQLRLRDIGGIIVIDFIDMVLESNRDLVLRRLVECLGRDRTKHQVAEVTSLGLVQMTRKRVGQGLVEAFSTTCEHCNGRGFLVHAEPNEKNSGGATGQHGGSESPATASGQASPEGEGKRSRRKRGGSSKDTTPDQAQPQQTAPSVPVLPESQAREAVNATLATIAAAAAQAHEQAEQAGEQASESEPESGSEQKDAAKSHVMAAEQATFPGTPGTGSGAESQSNAEPGGEQGSGSADQSAPEPAEPERRAAEPKRAPARKPATRRKATKPAGAPATAAEAEPVGEADKSAEGTGRTD